MFKKFSKFIPQIIALLFLVGFVAYAWQEPPNVPGAPPAGNVDAPINVGSASQYKSGALGIGGLLRGYSDTLLDGKITANRLELPEISSPAIPAAGKTLLYIDTADGKIKMKKSDGSVIIIGGARAKDTFSAPGPFSFTVPEGITSLDVTIVGGGGGGGAGQNCSDPNIGVVRGGGGGGGGGGGQAFQVAITVTSGQVLSGSVGAGGSGGLPPNPSISCNLQANSGSGATTQFGIFQALGGSGGSGANYNTGGSGGLAGGSGGTNGVKGGDSLWQNMSGAGGAGGVTTFSPYGFGGVGGEGFRMECCDAYYGEIYNVPATGGSVGPNGVVIIEY